MLKEHAGANVQFVTPPPIGHATPMSHLDVDLSNLNVGNCLDSRVFTFEYTTGVQGDIQRAGKRTEETIVMFVAASQFNGAESKGTRAV